MLWVTLSLAAALTQAINDAISKRFFSHLTAYEMGLIRLLYAFPYLLFGLVVIPRPPLDRTFWYCLGSGLPLEMAAFICYMKAIKVSPLSLTVPFLSFTPAFVIVTGHLILNESLTVPGMAGIFLILTGSYLLNFGRARDAWLAPLRAIFQEQGSWLMIITALLYSMTSTLGKLAIKHSSPQFFAVSYFLFFTLFILILFPFVPGAKVKHLFKRPIIAALAGLVLVAMVFSHTLAISLIQVAYMLSLKRSSLLFGVIFGLVFFKEGKVKERLLGAFVMLTGVLIIGFFG